MEQESRPQRLRYTAVFPPEWRVLGFLAILVLTYVYLRPLLSLTLLFITGLLLAAAFHPTLTWMEQRSHLPRSVWVVLFVLVALGAGYALLNWAIPVLLTQLLQLVDNIPAMYDRASDALLTFSRRNPLLGDYLRRQAQRIELQSVLTRAVNELGVAGQALLEVLFAGVLVMVVAVYSLMHPVPLVRSLLLMWQSAGERDRVAQSVDASLEKIRSWLFGQLSAMLVVGILSAVALHLLGVPFAFTFGVLAGLLEIVPTIGPILSALPPMVVAFMVHPLLSLWVALAFLVVQSVENHIIIPLVYAGALRIHPVAIAFAVLTMGSLFGVLGIFVAIPLLAIGQVIYEEFYQPPAAQTQEAQEQARSALGLPNAAPEGRPPAEG